MCGGKWGGGPVGVADVQGDSAGVVRPGVEAPALIGALAVLQGTLVVFARDGFNERLEDGPALGFERVGVGDIGVGEDALCELCPQSVPSCVGRLEAIGGVATVEMHRPTQDVGPQFERFIYRHGRLTAAG